MGSTSKSPGAPPSGELTIPAAMELALKLHQAGDVVAAEQIYRRVLALIPAHPDALHFLGMARFHQGDRDGGIELVYQALVSDPAYADARNNLGNMLLDAGRVDEAEKAYLEVLARRPDHASSHSNVGLARLRKNDLAGAEAAFREAIARDPDHGGAYHNLGSILRDSGRNEEALVCFQRALALTPYDGESYRRVGATLYGLGRVPEAIAMYERWVELEPNNPSARHMLAACTGRGAPERASDAYVKSTFDDFAASFDRVLTRLEYRAPALIADAVGALVGAPAANLDVLDAGAGTGWCGPLLRPYARRLEGVDLSPSMLEQAKKRGNYDALEVAELTAFMRDRPGRYDLIISADTLVYFGELSAALAAAAGALRPGGALVFTVEHALDEPAEGHRINPHGRYSHGEAYVDRTLRAAGLTPVVVSRCHLRIELQKPVDGLVITAKRNG